MISTDSVSVHIRRGDYVGSSFDILSRDYYINAMKYMAERLTAPVFYFFSDDPEYVRKEYNDLPFKYEIIDWNTGAQSFWDMQLMSMCKHNIICNSTFSLWGAILNKYSDKLVIRPDVIKESLIPSNGKWIVMDRNGNSITVR